jgi:membrane protease YdiL (CAAX protease family)
MDLESPPSGLPPALLTDTQPPTLTGRAVAALEVLLCSDYPTQLLLGGTFGAFGFRPAQADGTLSLAFVVALSLIDTVLLVGLIVLCLRAHGERPRDVFLGRRAIGPEVRAGLPMTLVVFGIAILVLGAVQWLAPRLHTVERNPLQDLVKGPGDAALFALVVVVAGGVREELQRAFLMHRFEHWLGGARLGVVVASVFFGLGHLLQGVDAAIATGCLGAFWAIVYLRRRSVVAPVVSHSGFNLLQLLQLITLGR